MKSFQQFANEVFQTNQKLENAIKADFNTPELLETNKPKDDRDGAIWKFGQLGEVLSVITSRSGDGPITDLKSKCLAVCMEGNLTKLSELIENLADGSARMYRYGETPTGKGLAPSTVKKRISNTKTLFQDAVNRKLIPSNPFNDLKGTAGANRDRDYFVTHEETYKVINACPDAEWRLIVALARFGGIRIPSELVTLQWSDINWEEDKITIHSEKTASHLLPSVLGGK